MRFDKDERQPLFKKTGSAKMTVFKYRPTLTGRSFALKGYPVHRATWINAQEQFYRERVGGNSLQPAMASAIPAIGREIRAQGVGENAITGRAGRLAVVVL